MDNNPLGWIERIHTRLAVRYGARWFALWAGYSDDDMLVVRQDWAHVLTGQSDAAIQWALDNVPGDYVPNATQFVELCRRMPVRQQGRLDYTPLERDPERSRALMEQAHKALAAKPDPLQGYRELRQREASGERLTEFQRKAWREALRHELRAEQQQQEEQS